MVPWILAIVIKKLTVYNALTKYFSPDFLLVTTNQLYTSPILQYTVGSSFAPSCRFIVVYSLLQSNTVCCSVIFDLTAEICKFQNHRPALEQQPQPHPLDVNWFLACDNALCVWSKCRHSTNVFISLIYNDMVCLYSTIMVLQSKGARLDEYSAVFQLSPHVTCSCTLPGPLVDRRRCCHVALGFSLNTLLHLHTTDECLWSTWPGGQKVELPKLGGFVWRQQHYTSWDSSTTLGLLLSIHVLLSVLSERADFINTSANMTEWCWLSLLILSHLLWSLAVRLV